MMAAARRSLSNKSKLKLGEILVGGGVITPEQMEEALKRQKTMGGRLGQNLIYLGSLDEDTLIKVLADHLRIACVDLKKTPVTSEVQQLIPLETIQRLGVLPLTMEKTSLVVGMTDPTDMNAIQELEFSLGMKVIPMAMAESQWNYALHFFTEKGWGRETLRKTEDRPRPTAEYGLTDLLERLLEMKGSDIHLSAGVPPSFRIQNDLVRVDYPILTADKIRNLILDVLTEQQREALSSRAELDLAIDFKGIGRFRVNVYRQRGQMAAALRHVADRVPSLKELNLPVWLQNFAARRQGLILITGPSGHGKSTTMACLIDIINTTRRANIVTLEDPIEYVHHHKMSNVNQRELGTDTSSFHDGIRYIFRQDPDVISVGEMRDLESISTALTAAETGHLVLATLHTLNATSTIDRIIDIFPGDQQNQVRHQIAESFLLILSQRLVPRADGSGRILAFEKLSNSYRVQNAIREKRVHFIRSQYMGSQDDFLPMEVSLARLCQRGLISYEEGRKFAEDPKIFDLVAKK